MKNLNHGPVEDVICALLNFMKGKHVDAHRLGYKVTTLHMGSGTRQYVAENRQTASDQKNKKHQNWRMLYRFSYFFQTSKTLSVQLYNSQNPGLGAKSQIWK